MNLSEDLFRKLEADATAERKGAWESLDNDCSKYVWTEEFFYDLYQRLKEESDLDVRSYGLASLERIQLWARSHPLGQDSLQSWLLKPFQPVKPKHPKEMGRQTSAVVAICDREHVRDVQPLVKLARVLHEDAYWNTSFHHIPLDHPDWERVGLAGLRAVCFVGRPSMFVGCDLLNSLPDDRHFDLPKDHPKKRGKPLGSYFHSVVQQRPTAGKCLFKAEQHHGHRTDYALVQRFLVRRGGHKTVVLIVAGATSLGTVGAADWLTSRRPTNVDLLESIDAAGSVLRDDTRVEVLLKVTAVVHSPPRPWEVEDCIEEKLLIDGGPNVLSSPKTVTLGMKGDSVRRIRYVLLDDNEIILSGPTFEAFVAMCWKSHRDNVKTLELSSLIKDRTVWPKGQHPFVNLTEKQIVTFFREHLKNGLLRDSLSVLERRKRAGTPVLKFNFEIQVKHQ